MTKNLKLKTNRNHWALLATLLGSLLLVACGDSATSTPDPKTIDLPRDRVLVLSNRDGWPDLYTVDLSGKFIGRLTESAAAEYGAVWSPDGRKIAFTELNGDQASGDYGYNRRIIVIEADGKNRRVVAQDGFNPVWSPDGQKILFSRVIPAPPVGQRPASNIAAAPPEQLNATPSPSQSSNIRIIEPTRSATSAPQVGGNFLISPNALSPVQATPDSGPIPDDPATPPPATNAGSKGRAGLYLVAVEGSAAPVLLAADGLAGSWSPDSKRIAFIAGTNILDQKRTLNVINADGKEAISLTERAKLTDLDVVYIAWSPDGAALAFTATDTQRGKTALYRLSPDGTASRRLTDYDGSAREIMSLIWAYADFYNPAARLYLGPVWSPNSRSLAFSDGSARLSVVDASNANVRYFPVGSAALGQDKDSVLSLKWLPDSRRLLYDRAAAGRNTLQSQAGSFIYDFFDETLETLDTVNKNTLTLWSGLGSAFLPTCCGMDLLGAGSPSIPGATATSAKAASPSATANGATIAGASGKLVYVSGIGQRQLIVHDLKNGQRTTITAGQFKLVDFNIAPKGDRLAYVEVGDRFNAALYVAGLDGKQKRKITEGGGNPDELSYLAAWSSDGQQLAFQALANDPNLKSGLYTIRVDGPDNALSAPRLITDKDVASFAWSPDGQQIAYKVNTQTYELYLSLADGTSPGKQIASLGRFDMRYSSLGRGLVWSPDGRYLAMSGAGTSGYGAYWQLWLVTPQGKAEEHSGYFIGRLVGFTSDSSRLLVMTASSNQSSTVQTFVMPTSNGVAARGWRSYDRGSGPVAAPDASAVAFYTRTGDGRPDGSFGVEAQNRLVIVNFSNGLLRPVSLEYTPYYAFKARFYAWQQDGKAVAYYQNNTIYLVNSQGPTQKSEMLARAFAVDHLGWAN